MSKRPLYRYEPRDYSEGDIILPDFDLAPKLTDRQIVVEAAIMSLDPILGKLRSQALYTWQSQTMFERLITGKAKQTKLLQDKQFYELEINEKDIMFRGNLLIYNEAERLGNTHPLFEETVRRYIAGCHVSDPSEHVEVLVTKARVLKRYDSK